MVPPELPRLLPLDPLMDVALDPVVDVPLEPTTGVLGAMGAVLGAVLPEAVLGGLPLPSGVGRGIPAAPDGRTTPRRATPTRPTMGPSLRVHLEDA